MYRNGVIRYDAHILSLYHKYRLNAYELEDILRLGREWTNQAKNLYRLIANRAHVDQLIYQYINVNFADLYRSLASKDRFYLFKKRKLTFNYTLSPESIFDYLSDDSVDINQQIQYSFQFRNTINRYMQNSFKKFKEKMDYFLSKLKIINTDEGLRAHGLISQFYKNSNHVQTL